MPIELKPRTRDGDGQLWGARASDWADIQESTARPVYEAALERTRVMAGTRYLDVGCGAGMVAQTAASRSAQVSGIDTAEALGATHKGRKCSGSTDTLRSRLRTTLIRRDGSVRGEARKRHSWLGALKTWLERRRSRRTLAGLDDDQLRDVGLSRADALHESAKPFWRR